jgi:hypothetical protein
LTVLFPKTYQAVYQLEEILMIKNQITEQNIRPSNKFEHL